MAGLGLAWAEEVCRAGSSSMQNFHSRVRTAVCALSTMAHAACRAGSSCGCSAVAEAYS